MAMFNIKLNIINIEKISKFLLVSTLKLFLLKNKLKKNITANKVINPSVSIKLLRIWKIDPFTMFSIGFFIKATLTFCGSKILNILFPTESRWRIMIKASQSKKLKIFALEKVSPNESFFESIINNPINTITIPAIWWKPKAIAEKEKAKIVYFISLLPILFFTLFSAKNMERLAKKIAGDQERAKWEIWTRLKEIAVKMAANIAAFFSLKISLPIK